VSTANLLIRLAFVQLIVLYGLAWGMAWHAQQRALEAAQPVLPAAAEAEERLPNPSDLRPAQFPGDGDGPEADRFDL
jgi:hypothetical protein